MNCPNCNKVIKDGAKFCGHCGADISLAKHSITDDSVDNIIVHGYTLLSSGSFDEARELFDSATRKDAKNVQVMLGKLLCDLKLHNEDELADCATDFGENINYRSLLVFADSDTKMRISAYQRKAAEDAMLAEKERKYNDACAALENGHYTDALVLLEELGNWKDSVEKIEICNQGIERQRIEAEKRAEEQRIQDEIQAKKIKKYAIIFSVALAAFIAIIILINNVIVPFSQYNKAMKLIKNGEYSEGYSILTELGDFNNAEDKIKQSKYDRALLHIENGEYDTGYSLLDEIGTYNEADKYILQNKYDRATALLNEGKHDEAYALLNQIGDYNDATSLVVGDKYDRAIEMINNKNYAEAYSLLMQIGGSNTSVIKARKDAYKGIVFTELAKYDANNDLTGAVSYLNSKLPNADADDELKAKYEDYKNRYRTTVLTDASTAFSKTGYASAIEIVEAGLRVLSNDTELLNKKSYYEEYIPVYLFNLNYEQGHEDNHTWEKGPTTGEDCDGNTYTNCYEMHTSMSEYAYLVFDLDKKYSKFTGTFYWSSEHGRSFYNYEDATETLYIYNVDGDEPKLLYEVTLNCYSEAVTFSIDVSGIDKLEVANYCAITRNSFADTTPCLSEFKVQK